MSSTRFASTHVTVATAVAALLSVSAAAAPGTPGAQVAPAAGARNDVMFYSAAGAGCPPTPMFHTALAPIEPQADAPKNAPYAGVGTTEVVNTLADGNRIVRNNTMRYYRDGKGRTRTEYSLAAIGPFTPDRTQTIVTINDPVAGERYVLHSVMKRADVFKISGDGTGPGRGFFFRRMESDQGVVTTTGVAGAHVVTGVIQSGGAGAPPPPPVVITSGSLDGPPGNAMFVMRAAPAASIEGCKMETKPLPAATSLGERTIEGLKVTGSRRDFTIEAGAVGNEQPMVVSTEQWFSPELGVVVQSSHHDPMIGDTNYKLQQISRAEPDASLFKVPADYTKHEVPAPNLRIQTFEDEVPAPTGGTLRVNPNVKPAFTGK